MSSLDVSLGDLISKNSTRGRGGARGGARGGRSESASSGPIRNKPQRSQQQTTRGTPYQRAPQQYQQYTQPLTFAPAGADSAKWTRDLYAAEPAYGQQQQQPAQPAKKIQGDTIHVSNLASDLVDEDVRKIFEGIGKVTSCHVNWTRDGQSTGTATVTFARAADAEKAYQDYNEAEVDGRVMYLKLVGQVVSAPVVVKKSRPTVVPASAAALPLVQQQPVFLQQPMLFQQPIQYAPSHQQRQPKAKTQPQQQPRAANKPTRGRGALNTAASTSTRGGRGGARQSKPVTAEDLDAEMAQYHSAAAPSSAEAAGQPVNA